MIKINYKDYYGMDTILKIDFPINVYFENDSFDMNLLSKCFLINKENKGIKIIIKENKSLKNDGYTLRIKEKEITITFNNKRGLRYAYQALNKCVDEDNSYLDIIYIEDEPSFRLRGIIEGYYGTPWTYEERKDMVSFMDENRLNVYMYAPKSDIYHREKWNVLYPDDEFNQLIGLKKELEKKDVDFFYCISPGYKKDGCKSFDYCEDEDYEILYKKLDQVIKEGVSKFGLLLDDIDYTLTGKVLERFKTPGVAHSYICNKVYEYLKKNVYNKDEFEMVMCPTEYTQIGSTPYREDLKNNMNKEIAVFWTGYNCCAEVITSNDARVTQEAFGSPLFVWDNFPVSDFTYGVRQYMAPLINRGCEIGKYADAYIINPMTDYYISKISMYTMADYAWNSSKYDPEVSFFDSIATLGIDFFNDSYDYIQFNYPNVLSYGNLQNELELVQYNDHETIKEIYRNVRKSCQAMLKYDLKIVEELKPWLEHAIKEEKIVKKIIDKKITEKELKRFLQDIKFSGSQLLDYLIKKEKLLNEEDYESLITKRRGRAWYRVWERR